MRLDLVRLGDEHRRPAGQREVVEERRGSIDVVRIAWKLRERHDRCLIDGPGRALCRRVVGPDRLDRVAHELEPDRSLGTGRIEVDDPAADAELARLVDRILPGVTGGREQIGEIGRGDVESRRDDQRGRLEPLRRGEPGQQRGGGGDDDPGGAGGQRVEGARAGRGDVEVRRHAAIRIHLV